MLIRLKFIIKKWTSTAKKGSALILTMFILAGMLIVAMSGSYVILLGIKAGGLQAQSTKAYFAAEAGAERLLWELRKNGYSQNDQVVSPNPIFVGTMNDGSTYKVYYSGFNGHLIFTSVGESQSARRSVEIRI